MAASKVGALLREEYFIRLCTSVLTVKNENTARITFLIAVAKQQTGSSSGGSESILAYNLKYCSSW